MEMRIRNLGRDDAVTIVDIKFDIDMTTVARFKQEMQKLIRQGRYKLILNFQGVSYLNSAALGTIAATFKKVHANKGDLRLLNLSPPLQEHFELVKFTSIMQVFDDESEAIESFY